MRKHLFWLGLSITAVAVSGAPGCADMHKEATTQGAKEDEHEDKIALDQIPAAVTDGVKKAMPDGTITDAEKETKDGKTVYEMDVKSGGKTYEVKAKEDGKIVSSKIDDDEDEKDKK